MVWTWAFINKILNKGVAQPAFYKWIKNAILNVLHVPLICIFNVLVLIGCNAQ